MVGAVIRGPPGAIAGAALAPLLEPFAEKVWGELRCDAQQRQGETFAAAQEVMGGDPEELERLILASDQSRLQAGHSAGGGQPDHLAAEGPRPRAGAGGRRRGH